MPADKAKLEDQSSASPPTPNQAGAEPSGYRGDNPSTGGPGQSGVISNTPENKAGHLDPSAPENSNITPGSAGEK